jgi:hypothetical protein
MKTLNQNIAQNPELGKTPVFVSNVTTHEEVGREDGLKNFPPSDATEEVGHDAALTNKAEIAAALAKQAAEEELNDLGSSVANHKDEVKAIPEISTTQAELNMKTVIANTDKDEVIRQTKDFTKKEESLRQFMRRRNLEENPNYYEGGLDKLGADVAWIAILESLPSVPLLSSAHPDGLVGSLPQGLIISVVNVGVSLGFGYGLSHIDPLKHPIIRKIIITLYGVLAIGGNCLVGLYREAMLIGDNNISLTSLLGNIPNLGFESLLLIALSLLFSIGAFVRGLRYDSVPGFREVYLDFIKAKSELETTTSEVMAKLGRIIDDAISGYTKQQEQLSRIASSVRNIFNKAHALVAKDKTGQEQISSNTNDAKRQYRKGNKDARHKNSNVPSYFNSFPDINVGELAVPEWLNQVEIETTELEIAEAIQKMKDDRVAFIEFVKDLASQRGEEYREEFKRIMEDAEHAN